MVHLDTNVLIGLADPFSPHRQLAGRIVRSGESLAVSAVVWYEFCKGPLDARGLALIRSMLAIDPVPFGVLEAEDAARLFNQAGRARRLTMDVMIAACAIRSGAAVATANLDDFKRFQPFGLTLFEAGD